MAEPDWWHRRYPRAATAIDVASGVLGASGLVYAAFAWGTGRWVPRSEGQRLVADGAIWFVGIIAAMFAFGLLGWALDSAETRVRRAGFTTPHIVIIALLTLILLALMTRH